MFYTYIPGGAGLGFTEPSTTVGLCEYSPQSFVTSRDLSHEGEGVSETGQCP